MVTHDPIAAAHADRVVFLADGRIVDEMREPTPDSDPRQDASTRRLRSRHGTMWKVTLKGLAAHKLRFVLTGGCGHRSASRSCRGRSCSPTTIRQTFDDLFAEHLQGHRRGGARDRNASRDQLRRPAPARRRRLDARHRCARCPGWRRPRARSGCNYAQIVDADGNPIGNPGAGRADARVRVGQQPGAQQLPHRDRSDRPRRRRDRHRQALRQQGGLARRSTRSTCSPVEATAAVQDRRHRQASAPPTAPPGASIVLFTLPEAQRIRSRTPRSSSTDRRRRDPGMSQETLNARLQESHRGSATYEVLTGKRGHQGEPGRRRQAARLLQARVLTIFAFIALSSSRCFIIYNTFTIVVAQRTREMALLRAIGASGAAGDCSRCSASQSWSGSSRPPRHPRRHPRRRAASKALLARSASTSRAAAIVVMPSTVGHRSLLVGASSPIVSAIVPAWKAARIPPIAAMRDVAFERPHESRLADGDQRPVRARLRRRRLAVRRRCSRLARRFGIRRTRRGRSCSSAIVHHRSAVRAPTQPVLGAPLPTMRGHDGHARPRERGPEPEAHRDDRGGAHARGRARRLHHDLRGVGEGVDLARDRRAAAGRLHRDVAAPGSAPAAQSGLGESIRRAARDPVARRRCGSATRMELGGSGASSSSRADPQAADRACSTSR